MTAAQLLELQKAVPQMQVSDALLDYVQALINHTRHSPRFTQGLSPRAGVAVLRAAQAWAMMEGRRQVLPEDVQAILPSVVGHRLHGNAEAVKGGFDAAKELIARACRSPSGLRRGGRMLANLRQSISDWIFRAAVPEAPPVTLVQRRIFILPTRQGYLFAVTLLLLLLASINYALSLGFVLTFLLAAWRGVAMLHTWRNLAHLQPAPGPLRPGVRRRDRALRRDRRDALAHALRGRRAPARRGARVRRRRARATSPRSRCRAAALRRGRIALRPPRDLHALPDRASSTPGRTSTSG